MNPAPWFRDYLRGGQTSSSGIVVSMLRAMQETTVASCVSIRSGDLAKLPVHVYRRLPNGGKEIHKTHPIERLFRRPNSWQTRFELIEMLQANLLLRQNAYAVIRRNGRYDPIELIPISSDRVQLWESPDGGLFYWVVSGNEHERAQLKDFTNPIPAADMLHIRGLSLGGLMGLSRIAIGRDAIGLSLALEEHSARLFQNGARPGGVLQTDGRLADGVYDRLRADWDESYGGVGNTGKTPILEEGLKWETSSMTSVESETIAARRLQIEQIAMLFDVPLHRLGVNPKGGDSATAILQANQTYQNNVVANDAERWEAKLESAFGIDGVDTFIEFDLDHFNRADIQTRFSAYRAGIVGMFLKPNEARAREGLSNVPGGDKLYQPTNVAPIGFDPAAANSPAEDDTGPGSDVTGAPAPGGDGDPAAVPSMD